MSVVFSVINSLEKVFPDTSIEDLPPADCNVRMFMNDRFSFQIAYRCDEYLKESKQYCLHIESTLDCSIQQVVYVPSNLPRRGACDDGYLFSRPAMVPDLLLPADGHFKVASYLSSSFFCTLSTLSCCCGKHEVKISVRDNDDIEVYESTIHVMVLDIPLYPLAIDHTEWFHQDSLLSYYKAEVWSEFHWALIEKWMTFAHERCAINVILTPVFTPPLDTAVGKERQTVQLVDIFYDGENYYFDFSKLKRWCLLCVKSGIKTIEIPHFFTQWGAACAPKIVVNEKGCVYSRFGWHTNAMDPEYKYFLESFIPALKKMLNDTGFDDNHIIFHISDEPRGHQIEQYSRCKKIVEPLVGKCRIIDALSSPEFYERNIVTMPVISNDHVKLFDSNSCRGKWVYYCVSQNNLVPNRFMALPSARCRIMGTLIWLYGFSGFLHWGYNFYFCQFSEYPVNPFVCTDADHSFPSGDPFLVYPSNDGNPLSSLRNEVQMDGFADLRILRQLEIKIGRDAVLKLIDNIAGERMDFEKYPLDPSFFSALRNCAADILEQDG